MVRVPRISTGRSLLCIALAAAVLTAGCVGVPADLDEEPHRSPADDPLASDETEEQLPDQALEIPYPSFSRNDTRLQGNISQEVGTGWRETGVGWSIAVPGRPTRLSLYLQWTNPANDLGLRVERPDGRTMRFIAEDPLGLDSRVWETLRQPPGGTYRFDVLARDATHGDTVQLDLDWRRGPEDWIETRDLGDGVQATATWRDGTLSSNRTRVAVDVPQGNVSNVLRARDSYAEAVVRQTAPNASAAIRKVKGVDPNLDADNGRLRVKPIFFDEPPVIDVVIRTPPTSPLHGRIETERGGIDLQGLSVHEDGLGLSASDGVNASLRLLGDLTVRAGESTDLSLGARADASLDVNATGGDVRIALPTDRPVLYNLTLDANATLETSVPGTEIVERGNASYLRGGADGADVTLDGTVEAPSGAIVFVPYEADG